MRGLLVYKDLPWLNGGAFKRSVTKEEDEVSEVIKEKLLVAPFVLHSKKK